MVDKIRAYIDHAFADAPKTRKAQELKEERAGASDNLLCKQLAVQILF